jgi:hypothetical protein
MHICPFQLVVLKYSDLVDLGLGKYLQYKSLTGLESLYARKKENGGLINSDNCHIQFLDPG